MPRSTLLAIAVVVVTVTAACGQAPEPDPAARGTGAVAATSTAPPTATGSATTAPASPTGGAAPAPATDAAAGRPLLWPFADAAAARTWQEGSRVGGSQPWHLDSAATALGFTQGYLGFAGLDRVTTKEGEGAETWVGVGYRTPDGRDATAAVLHLVRLGTEKDAPWEVVGTRDTTLVIDTPAYGSAAQWPLTVGGMITGVDESLHVRVLGRDGPVADSCCAPAGGERTPWSVTVPRQGAPGPGALTVVVATGGHAVDVERFAITAVRAG